MGMRTPGALGVLILSLAAAAWAEPEPPSRDAREAALRTHVEALAADGMKGRGAWADRVRAAAYVAAAFAEAGLAPAPGQGSMLVDHDLPETAKARNVVAWLPGAKAGTTTATAGPYVIVSAHYDHLGVREGAVYNGADDNASGVAALIELAHMLQAVRAAAGTPFGRSVLFVAFDLEETKLQGSRRFAEEPPLPLAGCAAFVTMDMLGRSVADLVPGSLFVMGTESSAELMAVVDRADAPAHGRKIQLGIDFQPGYSDYEPFRERKIPYVFLTSGACSDYHRPGDDTAKIGWAHLVARTNWVRDLLLTLLDPETKPTWRNEPVYDARELASLHDVLVVIEQQIPDLGLPPIAGVMVTNVRTYLEKALEDDEVTPEEREGARKQTVALFQLAQALPR